MNAIPGGPYNFAHIGPHRIESGTGKRTSVSCSRNRYPTRFRLSPSSGYYFRSIAIIPQGFPFRVGGLVDQSSGAPLHASETALAQLVNGIGENLLGKGPFTIDI